MTARTPISAHLTLLIPPSPVIIKILALLPVVGDAGDASVVAGAGADVTIAGVDVAVADLVAAAAAVVESPYLKDFLLGLL